MRLALLTLMAFSLLRIVPAVAQDARTAEFLNLLDEVNENRRLFDMVVNSCFDELSKEKTPSNDPSALDKCVSSKGVQLQKVSAGVTHTPVHQMGRQDVDDSVLVYQIPQKEALIRRLQGGVGAAGPPDTGAQITAPVLRDPVPAGASSRTIAPEAETNMQKGSSARSKIYLPSKESEGSPRPIFLKR